jgi:hypothetical protein
MHKRLVSGVVMALGLRRRRYGAGSKGHADVALALGLLPLLLLGLASLLIFVLGPGTSAHAVYSGMSSMEGMSEMSYQDMADMPGMSYQDMANMPGMSYQDMANMPGMDSHTGVRVRGHVSYVSVGVAEEGIVMTNVTHAGPTTFHVLNLGLRAHRVRIEGPGVAKQFLLQSSEKESWTVTLRVGTYRVGSTDAAGVRRGPATTLRVTPL